MIDQAHLGLTIDLAHRAIVIGKQLASPPLLHEASVTLAQAQLCAGSIDKALLTAEAARRHRASRRSLRPFVLYGITALRIGNPALAKASFTFVGGVDYIAWKIDRHAGTDIRIKPWQRRWPLLAAVSLLPQLLRSGAVR